MNPHPNMSGLRPWKPGQTCPPESRKNSTGGRTLALRWLDQVLAEEGNEMKFKAAVREAFDKNPMRFFERFIMPLLPKEARLSLDSEGVIKWQSLLVTHPIQPSDLSMLRDATGSESFVAVDDSERPALPPPNSSTSQESTEEPTPG